ncbi:MAG: hypothetical protein ACPGRF_06175, partial [Miltoncostaeaceae bacterium]
MDRHPGGIMQLDTLLAGIPGMTGVHVVPGDKPAVVDCGSQTSAGTVRDALAAAGIAPDDLAWIVLTAAADHREDERQDALAPFYQPPSPLPDVPPGTVLRSEPLGVAVTGGRAVRMLYMSQTGDGEPRVASGMAFIPDRPAPSGGRRVVAWDHGTIGLGDQCAPSRQADPLPKIPWVEQMMALGWVVTATDYAGLG